MLDDLILLYGELYNYFIICVYVLVAHSCLTDCDPLDCNPPRLFCPWDFPGKYTGYWRGLPFPPPGDLPDPGMEFRSLTLQADSLPSEPPGKPTTR